MQSAIQTILISILGGALAALVFFIIAIVLYVNFYSKDQLNPERLPEYSAEDQLLFTNGRLHPTQEEK